MNIDEMIEVLQAAKNGEKIESRHLEPEHWQHKGWHYKLDCESFNFINAEYRIAPKPEPVLVPHWPAIVSDHLSEVYTPGYMFKSLEDARKKYKNAIRLATEYPAIMLPVEEVK